MSKINENKQFKTNDDNGRNGNKFFRFVGIVGNIKSNVIIHQDGKTCRPDVVNKIAKALNVPVMDIIESEVV